MVPQARSENGISSRSFQCKILLFCSVEPGLKVGVRVGWLDGSMLRVMGLDSIYAVFVIFNSALQVLSTAPLVRPALRSEFSELLADLVGFWKTETIASAVEVDVFNTLLGTLHQISTKLNLHSEILHRLLMDLGGIGAGEV